MAKNKYIDIDKYIADIKQWLMASSWHYTEEQADRLIKERMKWIEESFEKGDPIDEIAVDVGYCCG